MPIGSASPGSNMQNLVQMYTGAQQIPDLQQLLELARMQQAARAQAGMGQSGGNPWGAFMNPGFGGGAFGGPAMTGNSGFKGSPFGSPAMTGNSGFQGAAFGGPAFTPPQAQPTPFPWVEALRRSAMANRNMETPSFSAPMMNAGSFMQGRRTGPPAY